MGSRWRYLYFAIVGAGGLSFTIAGMLDHEYALTILGIVLLMSSVYQLYRTATVDHAEPVEIGNDNGKLTIASSGASSACLL